MKNLATFTSLSLDQNHPPSQLLERLEEIYGDPNLRARAARRLYSLKQREDQSFAKFVPQIEREFSDAGALDWNDEAKRQILLGALNKTMIGALCNRGVPSTFQGVISRLHEISTDLDMLDVAKRSTSFARNSQAEVEMMEWDPTPPAATRIAAARYSGGHPSSRPEDQALIGERAKWVASEELENRRREGRCLRCGRDGCRINRCPLAAAKPPSGAIRPRVATAATSRERPQVRAAAIEEEESGDEATTEKE
ncbi:hypothetical protein N7535_000091 [Penicillium sp. DV-2018c]|nr:hypothetical protein N7535_000091 [Penicillium sp. DV-2018c]